jgi:zinc protease
MDLPSGLRLVVEEDHTAPVVAVVAAVGVGSADDPAGQEGLAHLVEHMTFLSRHPGRPRTWDELVLAGTSYQNASTTKDTTTYMEVAPADALPQLLFLEGKRLANPMFGVDPADFEAERGVVLSEQLQRDEHGHYEALTESTASLLFPKGHPYAHGPGGTSHSVESITLDGAAKWAVDHYTPDRITIVVAGDVDFDRLPGVLEATLPKSLVESPRLKPHWAPEAQLPPSPAPAPAELPSVEAEVDRPTLVLAWTLPGGVGAKKLHNEALGKWLSATLGRAIPTWYDAVQASSVHVDSESKASILFLSLELADGADPIKLAEAVEKKMPWAWDGYSQTQVYWEARNTPRLRKKMLVHLELECEDLLTRAMLRAEFSQSPDGTSMLAWMEQALLKMTGPFIRDLGRTYVTPERARALLLVPHHAQEVSAEAPAALGRGTATRLALSTARVGALARPPHMDGLKSFTLPNGLTVTLLPRGQSGIVTVTLATPTKSSSTVVARAANESLTWDPHDGVPGEVGATLTTKRVGNGQVIVLRGAKLNLENLLAFLSERLTTQRVSDDSWSSFQTKLKAWRQTSLQARFASEFRRAMWVGLPEGDVVTKESLAKVSRAEVEGWLASMAPRGSSLSIAGDFDVKEAERWVRKWFEPWHGSGTTVIAEPKATLRAPDAPWMFMAEPGLRQARVITACVMTQLSSKERLAAELLGIKLRLELNRTTRSQHGESYGFQEETLSSGNGEASLLLYGRVASSSLGSVLLRERLLMASLAHPAITLDELNEARWMWSARFNGTYASTPRLAEKIATGLLWDEPPSVLAQLPTEVMDLTPDDLNALARKCATNLTFGVLADPSLAGVFHSMESVSRAAAESPAAAPAESPAPGP